MRLLSWILAWDGVPVSVVEHARFSDYDEQLVVPIEVLRQVETAARFAGSVCGIELELDASGRSTLGVFAAQFREERAKIERMNASVAIKPAPFPLKFPNAYR